MFIKVFQYIFKQKLFKFETVPTVMAENKNKTKKKNGTSFDLTTGSLMAKY